MLKSETNSQVLSADGQVLFRQVIQNGILCWQASGRTFPVVAGAEDPPPTGANNDDGADDDESNGSADDYDKDRAFRTIQKQRADLKVVRERERAAAKERDELKAKQRERDEADLSETERLKARTAELEREKAELERERQDIRTRQSIERAAGKAGLSDPEDAYVLLKPAEFDFDDDGALKNADKLVKALLEAKPYLAGKQPTSPVPGTPRSNGQPTRQDQVKQAEEKLIATRQYQPFG